MKFKKERIGLETHNRSLEGYSLQEDVNGKWGQKIIKSFWALQIKGKGKISLKALKIMSV